MLEEEVKPLTVAVESVETAQQMVGEEAEPLTALSNTALETALSGYTYSEYSLPPSETNVEIELDVFAEASPLSTAVSGSVSWHSMPRSETEVERMYGDRIGFHKDIEKGFVKNVHLFRGFLVEFPSKHFTN
ncbi:hypothetical protein KIN20_011522 [Parelaphostrongylus tenuis]|uniref:Uncharacterized protein n=1 Tax=Parelaphostrongylus tenuis TaxID=148309 RepID=A0AAD5M9K4_PARTN|nr:hypothetical protein KIN20_011522 [Parelaphostrongylus tenuis]